MSNKVIPGKLKLKGSNKGIQKKPTKSLVGQSTTTTTTTISQPPSKEQKQEKQETKPIALQSSSPPQLRYSVPYTKAELEFQLNQAKREKERVKKAAEKTHREKIEEFNRKLDQLSEHYDLPKVGPG